MRDAEEPEADGKQDSFETMSHRMWLEQSVSWMRFRKGTRSFSSF